jgi:hypothetical protein
LLSLLDPVPAIVTPRTVIVDRTHYYLTFFVAQQNCVVPNVWHLYTPSFLLDLFGRIEISLHSRKELVQIALLRHS